MERTSVIISNKAQCRLCDDVIESVHRHDWVACECGEIFVDGGKEYLHRGAHDPENIIDLSEFRKEGDNG